MDARTPEEELRCKGGTVEYYSATQQADTAKDANPEALECIALDPIGPAKIPPRRWLYGNFLLFDSAAAIGAVDGGGKGAIAVAMALSIITGKPLLGERVWRSGPVAIVTYEDDPSEWHRRIAAACLHYELDYETVLASIRFIHKPGGRISFGRMEDGRPVFPDSEQIVERLCGMGAVLLIVDPFNHAHGMEDGNNNVQIAKVASEISRIAREARVAALCLHHLRKGASGDPDDLMGATSLRATFRSARILARMTTDMAGKMKIPDPWRYVSIAGTKSNYAPPPERATWFRLVGQPLGNATEEYPDGDDVAVATTWRPRGMFEGMEAATLRAVFAALRDAPYGASRQVRNLPWAGKPLMDLGGRSEKEASSIIKQWLESGLLTKTSHYVEAGKRSIDRVMLNEAKAAEILGSVEPFQPPSA